MKMTDTIEQLNGMELAEVYDLHWLYHHDGRGYDSHDDEFNYCYDCANTIYNFLIGITIEKPGAKYLEIPDWNDCTEKNTAIKEDWGHHAYDTRQFCYLCGCILDVPLTNDGIESELDHFESIEEIKSPEDKRLFLEVLREIEYVESENFTFEFMTTDEIEEANQLYKRALDLLPKLNKAAV